MAHIISITDFDTPELDVYARLTENQLVNRADPANALFIAESPLVIGRALESGCVPVSFLMEPRHLTSQALPLLERCPEDIPVYTAAPEVLTRLTGFHLTRGMLCAMRRPALPTVEEVCANARRIAVLENVMNPTNIGAIFRCAAALGMDAGAAHRRRERSPVPAGFPCQYGQCVSHSMDVSGGSVAGAAAAAGLQTVAMALREDSLLLNDPRLMAAEKLAVVLGTEGDGLSDGTIAACDYTVRIPMTHGVDSLNVAAASAVAFYNWD